MTSRIDLCTLHLEMNRIKFASLVFLTLLVGLFFSKTAFAANFTINSLHYNGGTSYTISTPCCIHFPEYNSGVYKTSDDSLFSSFSSYSGTGDTWTINNLPKIPEGIYYFIIKGDRSQDLTIDSNGNAIIAPTPTPTPSAPIINAFSGGNIYVGDTYIATGSFSDPDSTSWTATVDYGDGSGTQPLTFSGVNFSLSHVYKDNGIYTVTVSVTDNQGAIGAETATITVNNLTPTVGAITAPTDPVQVNTAVTASASFTDIGVLDTHTAVWNWGDGITSGTVTESNGSGSVSDNHTYTAAGVYTITLTVTDKDGGIRSSTFEYVVVYDPSAGFVTGAGTITSPQGAYTSNTSATGELKFGIQGKYNNNTTPTGKTKLDFKTANFSFDSTSYQWLVINGNKAQLKGTGTINGSGNYTILVTALDGTQTGGVDKIRIKITDSSNNVIYDNQAGDPNSADPTTAITKGSLKVHN